MPEDHALAVEPISVLLSQFTNAANDHDLDALMSYFAKDCVYLASLGPDKDGTVHRGHARRCHQRRERRNRSVRSMGLAPAHSCSVPGTAGCFAR